eukprot:356046-Chlamydomonas_euryale.AAC.2
MHPPTCHYLIISAAIISPATTSWCHRLTNSPATASSTRQPQPQQLAGHCLTNSPATASAANAPLTYSPATASPTRYPPLDRDAPETSLP